MISNNFHFSRLNKEKDKQPLYCLNLIYINSWGQASLAYCTAQLSVNAFCGWIRSEQGHKSIVLRAEPLGRIYCRTSIRRAEEAWQLLVCYSFQPLRYGGCSGLPAAFVASIDVATVITGFTTNCIHMALSSAFSQVSIAHLAAQCLILGWLYFAASLVGSVCRIQLGCRDDSYFCEPNEALDVRRIQERVHRHGSLRYVL